MGNTTSAWSGASTTASSGARSVMRTIHRSCAYPTFIGRHGEPERLGGFEVDQQLEFGRLLDRQIGGLLALEDLPGINTGLAEHPGDARSKADQAAGDDETAEFTDHRNRMAECQGHELVVSATDEPI